MPHKPGSPADWLRHARSDLALSRTPAGDDVMLETLCFHAQQAAEKSLKAVLVSRGVSPPLTHNLRLLLDKLLPETPVPEEVVSAVELTDYAVTVRYPGEFEEVTVEEHARAIRLAEAVVAWAQERILDQG